MTPPLEARGLTKHYPLSWRRGQLVALQGLDLTVETGEVFGLLGPNGSGKSTALKVMLGLVEPTSGQARLFGESAKSRRVRGRLGFLPEAPYFYRFLTGEETLRLFGRLCGMGGKRLRDRIDELIALVGLEHGRNRPLGGYSKGMLQRIGLAQALVHDPELVLLDEPTAGVDPMGAREIRDLILRLKREGKTVVLCSHLLEQVEEVCDRVAILHRGRKLLEGRLTELLTDREQTVLQVRGWSASRETEARRGLEAAGVQIESVRAPRRTLEELFVELVREAEATGVGVRDQGGRGA